MIILIKRQMLSADILNMQLTDISKLVEQVQMKMREVFLHI